MTNENIEKIKNYLLGNNTDDAELFEEQLMSDDDFFQDFLAVEEELIQEYVDGELDAEQNSRFENHFLISEERLEKVKFAQSFRRHLDKSNLKDSTDSEKEKKPSFFDKFSSFFASPLPVAICLVIIAGLSGVLIWNFYTKSSDSEMALASLNKAFEQERPFESRISEFDYAPKRATRGSGDSKINQTEFEIARLEIRKIAKNNRNAETLYALGKLYLTEKNFDDAIENLEEAEKLDPENARIQNDLGIAYLEKSHQAEQKLELQGKASEKFAKAIELDSNFAEAYFNRAIVLQEQNLVNEAKTAWQEYLKRDSSSNWANEAKENLKSLEEKNSQSKKSENLIEDFLIAFREKDDGKAYEIFTNNREMIRSKLIPQELAFLFLKADKLEEKAEYLNALKFIGELEKEKTGDSFFNEIAKFYESTSDETNKKLLNAHDFLKSGYRESLAGKYEIANQEFIKAEKLFSENGDIWEAKICDYWIAYTDYYNDRIKKSTAKIEELSKYSEENNFKWLNSQALHWLSINANSTKEITKSLQYAQKSLELSQEVNDLYNQQKVLSWLATSYLRINQKAKAFSHLQKTLEVAKQPDASVRQIVRDFDVVSRLFFEVENYQSAIDFQKEMLALNAKNAKDSSFERFGLSNLGKIYAAKGSFDQALEFAEQSRNIAEKISDEKGKMKAVGYANLEIGDIERRKGDCSNASENYSKTIDAFKNLEFQSFLFPAMKGRLLCSFENQDFVAIEKELPETLKLFEENRSKIIEEQNKNAFSENEQGIYDLAIEFETAKENHQKAFEYSEISKSRSLLDLIKNGVAMSKDKNEILIERNSKPADLMEIQQRIPENIQIVQYAVLDKQILIWLIGKNNFKNYKFEISKEAFDEKITSFLEAVKKLDQTNQQKLSRELYTILFEPLENDLKPQNEIYIVPDKAIVYLPFAALINKKTNKYLVEDYKIAYAPSSNVFLAAKENAENKSVSADEKLLSIGNPSFDKEEFSNLKDLPNAAEEAETISKLYQNPLILLNKEATKNKILEKLEQADIIHFAGHYVVNQQDVLQSGFLVANVGQDSKLANFELFAKGIKKPKLIILSACETAVEKYYNGEGMIGAGRTFLALGVPNIVASQWQVDSKATSKLMQKFHKSRKTNNQTTISALQNAQIEMLKGEYESFRQPFYWAGFLSLGS